MEKKSKPKKTFALNNETIRIIDELSTKMGTTDNAVVAFAVHKLKKELA